jgi:hypothetical protein
MGKDRGKVTPKRKKVQQARVKKLKLAKGVASGVGNAAAVGTGITSNKGAASGVGDAVAFATGIASSVGLAVDPHNIPPPWAKELFTIKAQHEDPKRQQKHAKPGPKSTGEWPTLVAAWLITVARDNPKQLQNVDALTGEAQDFLVDQIKWAPKDIKQLRAKIVELLQFIAR